MGKLIMYYATMNSGKSIDLIRTAYNYEENGFKVLVMKPAVDTKGGNSIETRIGLQRKVDYKIFPNDKITDILSGNLENIDCIFIDEAQFLSREQVYEIASLCSSIDPSIICYSLRVSFKGELFPGSEALLAHADKLIELKTLCSCGQIARYVGRKVNGKFVYDGDVIVIDGADNVEYIPLCRKCFIENVLKKDTNQLRRRIYGK